LCPEAATSVSVACRCGNGSWGPTTEEALITTTDEYCIECSFAYAKRCYGSNVCEHGYDGAGCAACQEGFYTVRSTCYACPEVWVTGLLYTLFASLAIAAVFWTFHSEYKHTCVSQQKVSYGDRCTNTFPFLLLLSCQMFVCRT
jgi:hypothetical protein